jgi:uncharacterized protein YfaP (DUF2135 family)
MRSTSKWICFCLPPVFLFLGCGTEPAYEQNEEGIVVNPRAVMAELDPNFESVEVLPDRLVFTGKGPASAFKYKEGDILISSEAKPGFLRHVLGMQAEGKKLTVYTAEAGIAELFTGRLERYIDFSDGYDRPIIRDGKGNILLDPSTKYSRLRQPQSVDFHVNAAGIDVSGTITFNLREKKLIFSNVEISKKFSTSGQCEGGKCNYNGDCGSGFSCNGDNNPQDGKMEGTCKGTCAAASSKIGIKLNGYVQPNLSGQFVLDVGSFYIKQILVAFTGGMEINLQKINPFANANASFNYEILLGSARVDTPIPIFGPIVLPAALKFSFYLGTDNRFGLSGEASTSASVASSLTVGAEYRDGTGWRGILESNLDSSATKPTGNLNGNITLSVYVKPEIMFEFVRFTDVGPSVYLKPSLNLFWEFLPKRCLELFFNLVAGFQMKADALNKVCDRLGILKGLCQRAVDSMSSFDNEWNLYKKTFYNSCKTKVCKKDKVQGDRSEDVYWWDERTNQLVPDSEYGLFSHCDKENPPKFCCGGECVQDYCGKGNLEGLVVDKADESKKIQGASVKLTNSNQQVVYEGTTGVDGIYRVRDLDAGWYNLNITANGYKPYQASVQIRSQETTYVAKLEAIPAQCNAKGTISGRVADATNNQPISGAQLEFKKMSDNSTVGTVTTDQDGNYKSQPMDADYYRVVASAPGYLSNEVTNVSVCGYDDSDPNNDNKVVNLTLSPMEGNYHIVLQWGEKPKDLDLHAKLPDGTHIFYRSGCRGSRYSAPYAELDVDVRSGFGPETITITQPQAGTYQFFVHNYGGQNDNESTSLASSGARLVVSDPGGQVIGTFDVPGSCNAYFWYAFNLVFDSSGKATVQSVNNCGGGSNPKDYEDPPICNLP